MTNFTAKIFMIRYQSKHASYKQGEGNGLRGRYHLHLVPYLGSRKATDRATPCGCEFLYEEKCYHGINILVIWLINQDLLIMINVNTYINFVN